MALNRGWPDGCDIRWRPIEAPHMAPERCVSPARKTLPVDSYKRPVATCRSRVVGKNRRSAEQGRRDVRKPGQREDRGSFQKPIDAADTVVGEADFDNPSWSKRMKLKPKKPRRAQAPLELTPMIANSGGNRVNQVKLWLELWL